MEQLDLLQLWDRNICPNCGKEIPPGTRIGSGKKSDGGFCSLDCYVQFHALTLQEKAQQIQRIANQQN